MNIRFRTLLALVSILLISFNITNAEFSNEEEQASLAKLRQRLAERQAAEEAYAKANPTPTPTPRPPQKPYKIPDDYFTGFRSHEVTAEAVKRRDLVHEELKTLADHPWAGEYRMGEYSRINARFSIAPESGYLYEHYGCMDLIGRNYGKAWEEDGKILVEQTFENEYDAFHLPKVFLPIDWGEDAYLIPELEIIEFCQQARESARRSQQRIFLEFPYWKRVRDGGPLTGFPDVPAQYRYWFDKPTIEATAVSGNEPGTIFKVEKNGRKYALFRINEGSEHALIPGAKVRVKHETLGIMTATVVSTTPNESVCEVRIGYRPSEEEVEAYEELLGGKVINFEEEVEGAASAKASAHRVEAEDY